MAPQVETNSISLASHGVHTCDPGLYPVVYGLTIVREIAHQGYTEYGMAQMWEVRRARGVPEPAVMPAPEEVSNPQPTKFLGSLEGRDSHALGLFARIQSAIALSSKVWITRETQTSHGSVRLPCMSARALQTQQVKRLYRHSLKNLLSWAIRRDIFFEEVRYHSEANLQAVTPFCAHITLDSV